MTLIVSWRELPMVNAGSPRPWVRGQCAEEAAVNAFEDASVIGVVIDGNRHS